MSMSRILNKARMSFNAFRENFRIYNKPDFLSWRWFCRFDHVGTITLWQKELQPSHNVFFQSVQENTEKEGCENYVSW